jgi:copper homeostasis protein
MARLLEVIVTSVEDAVEAEAGGADRLELVRDLAVGGLTPDAELVRRILETVRIPVRVMLRQTPTMSADGEGNKLCADAKVFASFPIDGLVAGFLKGTALDSEVLKDVFAAAPGHRMTFHRAFDEMPDPLLAIEELNKFPGIDRILTGGGEDEWVSRRARLVAWQAAAKPEITLLVGAGTLPAVIEGISKDPDLAEIHIGRAARLNEAIEGPVQRDLVRALKSQLP